METGLRIAHISDPHFSLTTYDPRQFLSKRWMGNLNLLLFRNRAYQTAHLEHIPELLEKLKVEWACITGDFSSTSMEKEFELGRAFLKKFSMPTLFLPGNHDSYTKEADRVKRFYNYFPSSALKEKRIEKRKLGKGWWWIGLDCALPTPLFVAKGVFRSEMESELRFELNSIPKEDCVVLGNHFPLVPGGHPWHDLKNAKRLQEILKEFPQVKLYLHGHDHKPYIIDNTQEGWPLVLNSGSCAHKPGGTFYVLELFPDTCLLEQLWYQEDQAWVVKMQKQFKFRRS